jgi:hypothetical protein
LGLVAMIGNGMVTNLAGSSNVSFVIGGGTYLRGTMVVQDVRVLNSRRKRQKYFIRALDATNLFM